MELVLNGTFAASDVVFHGAFSASDVALRGSFGTYQEIVPDPYTGPYEATPSQTEQTFSTNRKTMLQDFVVRAIPQNYGLITYNGFSLTVS